MRRYNESHSRRVLRGFVAMSASSFAVMAVQLGYAAISSRLLSPSAFGAYAVAMSGVGFISMLGGSSLGQSAARREHHSTHLDQSLVTIVLLLGCTTTLLAYLLAPLWGQLWGVPESTATTRVMALGIAPTAVAAVMAGALRRHGKTTQVAGRTAVGQLLGMTIGLAAILETRQTWSLGVSSVAGQAILVGLLSRSKYAPSLVSTRLSRAAWGETLYGAKTAGMNILRQGALTLPSWSVGRFVGADALGAFNRATVLITLPLETAQRALNYAIFPEFRPDGPVSRSPGSLTDILILLTWPATIIGGLGYFLAGPLLVFLLGSQWTSVVPLAGMAVLLGVLPMIGSPLATALEALGRFRLTLWAFLASLPAIGAGVLATSALDTPSPAMAGLVVSVALQAGVLLAGSNRLGILSLRTYWAGIRAVVLLQGGVTTALIAVWGLVSGTDRLLWTLCLAAAEVALLCAARRRTAFWRIASARGLPGFA